MSNPLLKAMWLVLSEKGFEVEMEAPSRADCKTCWDLGICYACRGNSYYCNECKEGECTVCGRKEGFQEQEA